MFKRLSKTWRRRLLTLAKLVIGLALLGWVLAKIDPHEVWRVLAQARPWPIVWAGFLYFIGVVFSAWPWTRLLRPLDLQVSFRQAVELSLMGFCVNNLIPGGLGGDALRAWSMVRLGNKPIPTVACVLMDRWLAFLCLLVMVVVMSLAKWPVLAQMGMLNVIGGVWGAFALLLLISLGLFAGSFRPWQGLLRRAALGVSYVDLSQALLSYRRYWKLVLGSWALTLVTPLLDAAGFALIGSSLGMEQPWWAYVLMVPVMRVIHHIPVSVNAVGTQDVACVFYWSFFLSCGAPSGAGAAYMQAGAAWALSLSLTAHFLKLIVAALCGGIYLLSWQGEGDWHQFRQAELEDLAGSVNGMTK